MVVVLLCAFCGKRDTICKFFPQVNVFRERRALALSLNDTKTAVNKLHQMLNVLVSMLIIISWLLILKVATTHFFIFLSSQLLLVVFMFGNTCKTTFEAIIFLFVMHPFDVGDRVEVEDVQVRISSISKFCFLFFPLSSFWVHYLLVKWKLFFFNFRNLIFVRYN